MRHVHNRAEILADLDRMGGVQGLTLIAGLLPGGQSGAIATFLTACETALKTGPVHIVIRTSGSDPIEIDIE